MTSNILFLPFRRTHAVSLSSAIKQYISTKYDQHPDMFARDLNLIDRIRAEAVNCLEAHTSGIRKLTAYAAQLVWIGGKFPIDMGADFTWYPALGFNTQRPMSQNNLRFELANILYNLAALYSQLAISSNRSTGDGLKSACNYFCQAAGIISHIKTEVIPDLRTLPPEDMDMMTLESLQQLLLAQAQECFWSKAVKDGFKDGLIAKLAAKVSDFYDQAAEFGTKSDCISTDWIHHMAAKHHHFAAAAQYRSSRECLEKQNYGEEVARLRDSLICVNEALKEARWINKSVLADLHGLKSRITDDLKRAEKDNDVIYLLPVTPKSELATLGRAGMATPRVPTELSDTRSALGERGTFGQPLFAKLVPYSVHIAVSIYQERRDRIVNTKIVDELQNLTNQLKEQVNSRFFNCYRELILASILQSLNLPGSLQALEKPLGLPLTLTAHAEEIRQQNGIHRLRRCLREIATLRENDASIYKEGVEHLLSEADEENAARLKYGTDRWSRLPSQKAAEKLYAQAAEIDGYLKSARKSDELVESRLKESEKVLQVLAGSPRDLEEYVPSSRKVAVTSQVEVAATNLRDALNKVNDLGIRRKRAIEALRDKAKADDINPAILIETGRLEREYPMQKIDPAQFENLFEERLELYDNDREMVLQEQAKQKRAIAELKEANNTFTTARKGDLSTKQREQALQRLENGFIKYKEVVSNVDTGRKFYNDLASIVSKFNTDCKDFAYQRRVEAGHIESDLSTSLSNLSIAPHVTANDLQSQKQRESSRSHYSTPAPIDEPLTAPKPTRTIAAPPPAVAASSSIQPPGIWSPEMGIRFGGDTGANPPLQGGEAGVRNLKYPDAYANNVPTAVHGGRWDGTRGVMFG